MAQTTKRQRQLARERYLRQQARRAAAARRRRRRVQTLAAAAAVVAVVVGTVLVVRLAGGDDVKGDAAASPSGAATVCPAPDATAAPSAPSFGKEPPLSVVRTKKYVATIVTNCGTITVDLDAAKAPRAVSSMAFLAGKKYYDKTPCHRLTVPPASISVLQCGDPTGTGSGGPGYKFADENLPKDAAGNYPAGTLAMANSGKGTNGSQFFLVYKDTTLPPDYTVFGKVVTGLDVLQKIAKAGVDAEGGDGAPKQRVGIRSLRVAVQP